MFRLNWIGCDRWPGHSSRRCVRHRPQQDVQGRLPQQSPLRRDVQTRGVHGRLLQHGRPRHGLPCLLVHQAVPAGADDDDDVAGKHRVVAYG